MTSFSRDINKIIEYIDSLLVQHSEYFEKEEDINVIIKRAGMLLNFDYLMFPRNDVSSEDKQLEDFTNFSKFIEVFPYFPSSAAERKDIFFEFAISLAGYTGTWRKVGNFFRIKRAILKQAITELNSEILKLVKLLVSILSVPVSEAIFESWRSTIDKIVSKRANVFDGND